MCLPFTLYRACFRSLSIPSCAYFFYNCFGSSVSHFISYKRLDSSVTPPDEPEVEQQTTLHRLSLPSLRVSVSCQHKPKRCIHGPVFAVHRHYPAGFPVKSLHHHIALHPSASTTNCHPLFGSWSSPRLSAPLINFLRSTDRLPSLPDFLLLRPQNIPRLALHCIHHLPITVASPIRLPCKRVPQGPRGSCRLFFFVKILQPDLLPRYSPLPIVHNPPSSQ